MTANQPIIETAFGSIADKQVTFFSKKRQLSGRKRVYLPLGQVSSVEIETHRSVRLGVFLVLLGVALVIFTPVVIKIFGVLFLAWAILALWGYPTVVVTSGATQHASIGRPWMRPEAERFSHELRAQLSQL